MNLIAYIRLLNMRINSLHKQATNPFTDRGLSSYNPFMRPIYKTIVWVDADDEDKKE